MKTIDVLEKDKCTGCGVCVNICPVDAIFMKENSEGFLEPEIKSERCVLCGKCAQICPQMNDDSEFQKVQKAYAVICSEEIRQKCSSGGFFGAAAQWAASQNGVVYGAAFDEDFKKVRHAAARDLDTLEKLYKSKYLQSDTEMIYQEVRQNLENTDAPVIFCGCPCQVDALRRYLKKEYHNLIAIDIMCHGVVSPGVYKQFLSELVADVDSPIEKVDFRSRKAGWGRHFVVETKDASVRTVSYQGDYFRAFLWGYSQRKACFSCKYASNNRVGDLTIGDFWGIETYMPEMYDKQGTSLVLCNTEKGRNIFDKIKTAYSKVKECSYQEVIKLAEKNNWAIIKPGIRPQNREVFFHRLKRGDGFSQAFHYASTPQFDVGIFGWWFEDDWTNYGSTLTYYALMEYVSSLNLTVCMLTSPYHKRERASEFMKNHGYRMSQTYPFDQFEKHNENIDTFLIGSDQLWFYDCYQRWGHSLFLDFAADNKKKLAYATSFGHKDPKIPETEQRELKRLLDRFQGISVRENDGIEILRNKFQINAARTIDPVFLCDRACWDSIADEAERKEEEFLFSYMLDPDDKKIRAIQHLGQKLGLKMVSITDHQYGRKEKEEKLVDCGVLRDASICELIYSLKNANYVITDSFHGTCFSLIFRKPFTTIINEKRGTSRFDTLSELFPIGDRFVKNAEEIVDNEKLLIRPNYYQIAQLIQKESDRSKAWLSHALLV